MGQKKTTPRRYYYAVVPNDWREDNRTATFINCGHKHRTQEAAEKCRDFLKHAKHARTPDGRMVTLSMWYNGRVCMAFDDVIGYDPDYKPEVEENEKGGSNG